MNTQTLIIDEDAVAQRPRPLRDGSGRTIDHLRLSVTSACDLHCMYCRPDGRSEPAGRYSMTNAQRVELVAHLHHRFGLSQVRITGGEPLLEKGVVDLIDAIRRAAPRIGIAMTTNGRLLARRAAALRDAGLDRLNVSLDSLDPDVHRRMTGGELDAVLAGLDAARAAGFPSPKLNAVVLRELNDREIPELAAWALARGHEIRFLEAMPIGPAAAENKRRFVSADEIRQLLRDRFLLEPLGSAPGETAKRYAASAGDCRGVVGIIAPVTEPFCGTCRRIRVTADGRLFPCLLDSRSVDLRPIWRATRFDIALADQMILKGAASKAPNGAKQVHHMVSIGG
jgi:cyclic pyranopterin phosphate synthase